MGEGKRRLAKKSEKRKALAKYSRGGGDTFYLKMGEKKA